MRVWTVALASLFLIPWSLPASAQSAGISRAPVVYVTPAVARPGDTVFLSGGVFPRHVGIHFFMACPSWFEMRDGWALGEIPATDNHSGTFTALKMVVPTPASASHAACTLYVGAAADPFGVQFAFTILGKNEARLARRIDLAVRLPRKAVTCVRGETAAVQSAPGANLTIAVHLGQGKSRTVKTRLPWTGKKTLRLAGQSACGKRVHVVLKARLGNLSGQRDIFLSLPGRITRSVEAPQPGTTG